MYQTDASNDGLSLLYETDQILLKQKIFLSRDIESILSKWFETIRLIRVKRNRKTDELGEGLSEDGRPSKGAVQGLSECLIRKKNRYFAAMSNLKNNILLYC